jgi:hypothetical protein
MTTHMVRKQFYIQKRQDVLLKRLSEARGLSEAEIIRQAIEREAAGSTVTYLTRQTQETQTASLEARQEAAAGAIRKGFIGTCRERR